MVVLSGDAETTCSIIPVLDRSMQPSSRANAISRELEARQGTQTARDFFSSELASRCNAHQWMTCGWFGTKTTGVTSALHGYCPVWFYSGLRNRVLILGQEVGVAEDFHLFQVGVTGLCTITGTPHRLALWGCRTGHVGRLVALLGLQLILQSLVQQPHSILAVQRDGYSLFGESCNTVHTESRAIMNVASSKRSR